MACARPLSIKRARPRGNGVVESFNGGLRDELLGRTFFLRPPEARVVPARWRMDYNNRRPSGGLEWLAPAAPVAGLDDSASVAYPVTSPGVSPVGEAFVPPAHRADRCPHLS